MDALDPHWYVLHLAEAPVEVAEGQPENHCAQRREWEAAQASDDRDGVGADHEQGQARDVEREDGCEQDAGQRREHAADDPTRRGRNVGILAVEAREVPVVDDCSHRDAEPCAGEQRPQAERDARGDGEHDEVVPRDWRSRDVHDVCAVEPRERRGRRELGRRPHDRTDPQQRHEQADRDDDLRDRGRAPEVPHDDPLDDEAHERRLDEQHRGDRGGGRPMMLDAQIPIRERRDHRHCTVGEVEDSRCRVGDDEAARRDEVDAGEREPEDRVAEEFADHPNPFGSVAYVLLMSSELPGAQSKPFVPFVGDFGQ